MGIVDVLRKVAPSIAGAIGGPGGAIARSVLASILGKPEASDGELEVALANATPEQRLALKQADQAFALERDKLEQANRANARGREVSLHDVWTMRVIATAVVGTFIFIVGAIVSGHVTALKDPLVAGMIGTVIGSAGSKADVIIGYYFGTSFGSRQKDATIDKALDKGN